MLPRSYSCNHDEPSLILGSEKQVPEKVSRATDDTVSRNPIAARLKHTRFTHQRVHPTESTSFLFPPGRVTCSIDRRANDRSLRITGSSPLHPILGVYLELKPKDFEWSQCHRRSQRFFTFIQ